MLPRLLRFWNFRRPRVEKKNRYAGLGRQVTLNLESLEDRTVPTVNFTGIINGVVFADPLDTQVYNGSGSGLLSGVQVTLTGATNQGNSIDVSCTSDSNGAYSFDDVLPGTYSVTPGSVAGYSSSVSTSPGSDLVISDGNTITQNLGVEGGISPDKITMLQFLTTTPNSAYTYGNPGSGSGGGNYRGDSAPTISNTIATQTVSTNSSATQLDLAGFFTDPDMTNSQVTFNITNGGTPESLVVNLFDTTAPQTVANFFDYVNSGDYNNVLFTRLVSGFVLQGGGLDLNSSGNGVTPVQTLPAIPNEFGASNTADTLAMALTSGNANSGTDQFFFNLVNNSSSLDSQKFTVFGNITDPASLATLSTLASTSVKNESSSSAASANPTVDMSDIPLTNYSGSNFPTDATSNNFMVINSITTDNRDEWLTYSATSSNTTLVNPTISNEWLSLNYGSGQTGAATITVTATDRYGATVSQSFTVTVNPSAPVINAVAIATNNNANVTTLTATPTSTDPEGLPVSYAYQWFDNGTAIAGATSATLTLPASVAVGDKITVEVTPSDSNLTGTAFTSPAATIATINPVTISLPTVSSVLLSSNDLSDTTTLTAAPTSTDPNSKPVTFGYQWLENGTAISGATSATLTLPTNAPAGAQFSVEVTPADGTLTGTAFTSDSVTIQSLNPVIIETPTIQSVAVAPNSATNTTTLTATPTATDPYNQTITYAYQWLDNGTAISGATSATLTLPSATAAGDKITVQVTPSDSIITGAMFTSTAVVIGSVNPFTTEFPTVQSVSIAPDDASNATTLTANPVSTDPGGGTVTYSYLWLKNGTPISGATSNTLTIPGGISAGTQFSVQVTPSDGSLTGAAFTSSVVTVGSVSPVTIETPTIQSVAIAPNSDSNASTLTATPQTSDPYGRTVTDTYQWFLNGTAISGATNDTLTIPSGVAVGDKITVEVTANDGTISSSVFTTQPAIVASINPVTIELPAVQSVDITPSNPTTSSTLTATPNSTDPNGQTVAYSYQWLQNGNIVSGATSQTLALTPATANTGDTFSVEVTPTDGTLTGATFTSSDVTVS